MGCGGYSKDPSVDNPIPVRMIRLKHQINSNVEKLRLEAIKQQKVLLSQFKKPKSFRTIAAENGIASSIAMKINKIHIYEVVRCHIQKLIEHKNHLQSPNKAKQSLYPSIKVILYCQPILKDQSISIFCTLIKKRFPDVKQAEDQQIDSDIMRHHKKNQLPTVSMVNDYVLKLINQQCLDIAQVNKIGHNFRFGG